MEVHEIGVVLLKYSCHFADVRDLTARGGILPIVAYTGRLRPKGVPCSGFRYIKG